MERLWGILVGWPKVSRGLPEAPDDYGAWFYTGVATTLLLKAAARGRWTEGWKRKGYVGAVEADYIYRGLWKHLNLKGHRRGLPQALHDFGTAAL